MESYRITKEKLKSALQSEKTINFLKNTLNGNGFGLSNSPPNLNRFLSELTKNDHDIKIIEKGNRKRENNDIEIYGKKILVRTASAETKGHNNISFKSLKYEKEDKINFTNIMNIINDKLNQYQSIFFIRIEEKYIGDQILACYYYYLFPAEIFKIERVETINFDAHRKKSSLCSKYWIFLNYNFFYFKYNNKLLKTYSFCPCYISY